MPKPNYPVIVGEEEGESLALWRYDSWAELVCFLEEFGDSVADFQLWEASGRRINVLLRGQEPLIEQNCLTVVPDSHTDELLDVINAAVRAGGCAVEFDELTQAIESLKGERP